LKRWRQEGDIVTRPLSLVLSSLMVPSLVMLWLMPPPLVLPLLMPLSLKRYGWRGEVEEARLKRRG
jgi:hypothetical protein